MEIKDLLLANLGKNGHVDTLPIVREFYTLFWGERLETNEPDDFNGLVNSMYTGETIISFNTIAGCMIRLLSDFIDGNRSIVVPPTKDPECQTKRLDIITDPIHANEIPEEVKDNFRKFYYIYHTPANLMPLGHGLNGFRSRINHDFPDSFLKAVKCDCYPRPENAINTDSMIKFNKWEDYFMKFKTWTEYIEMNYLQPFFEDSEQTAYSIYVQLAPSSDMCMPWNEKCAKCMSHTDKVLAKKHIRHFLCNAIRIIENRADLLAIEFKKILSSNEKGANGFVENLRKHIDEAEKSERRKK